MDPLITANSHLLVGINALLEAGSDKEEQVRLSVTSSLCRLAKNYPCEVLRIAICYRRNNLKISNAHLITVLKAIEKICEEDVSKLDEITIKELIEFSMEEMIRQKDYVFEIQLPMSNVLVSAAAKDFVQVMEKLTASLSDNVVPHHTILHTLANLSTIDVVGYCTYIKSIMSNLVPLISLIKYESIRQDFAFVFGRICEAIQEYLSISKSEEAAPDEMQYKFSPDCVSDDIHIAFEAIILYWIQAREIKIIEKCVAALGPMFSLLSKDKRTEETGRIINLLLSLYKKSNSIAPFMVTQCLAMVLKEAPTVALESQLDPLLNSLGNMVIVTPDYMNTTVVKNHSEVLRCYDRLAGGHYREKLIDYLLKNMSSGSEKDKVEALIVINHLLSSGDNVLQPRMADVVAALRALLPIPNVNVKTYLLKAVVSVLYHGAVEDGSDLIEFVVKHCCPQTNKTGPNWENLHEMCNKLVHLLSTTVVQVQPLMWVVLQRLLLQPEYDAACPTLAKSLAYLSLKMTDISSDHTPVEKNLNCPPPEAVFARVVAFLGSPLHGNRGPYLLNFLRNFSKKINFALETIWNHKIPRLINYLEVSEWSEDEWDSLLEEFVTTSVQTIDNTEWTVKFANELSKQLPLFPAVVPEERGTILKCFALSVCHLNDKQIVSSHFDVILSALRSHTVVDSKACARATGIMSRKHLNLVLARLNALAQSELSRQSSRLLSFVKNSKTDLEVENARVTLLRCYSSVASEAEPAAFIPRIDEPLIQWIIKQLNIVKDNNGRDSALELICNIADTMSRNLEICKEHLKCRAELLAILLSKIESSAFPDPLLLRATASLVKLPPTLNPEGRTSLLITSFNKVFRAQGDNSQEEKLVNSSLVLKYLGVLVEEILLSSVNPTTLDDISILLEPWINKTCVQQRIAAISTLKTALAAYLQIMKFTYDAPSKFTQSGQMLGKIVVRCMDTESDVRRLSLTCAKLILLISAKYEGLSLGPDSTDLEEKFSAMSSLDSTDIAEDLALVISSKLSHFQYNNFSNSLLDGLTDQEFSSSVGSAKVLVTFFTKRGGELYHHISDLLSHLLSQLSAINSATRVITIQALLALAKHHSKAVISTLLTQPLPFSLSVCECWRGLVNDAALAADVLNQFLRLGASTPFIEESSSKSPNRPPVATHLPLAAISALKEMFAMVQMEPLARSRFPEVFTLYLSILALYIGVSPPVSTPATLGKMKFIPNREAYKINPTRVAQESFSNFLIRAKCESAADAVKQLNCYEFESNYESFLKIMPSLVRSLCLNLGHLLPKILKYLSPYFNSDSEAQRIAFISFHAELVSSQCGGQPALINDVIETLKSGLNDKSPQVRRICLKGLAYISFLDENQRECHCEAVLNALLDGLDDQDTATYSDIALQAMTGFSLVLPTVHQSHVKSNQVAIALRIKPFFEKEMNVCLRMTSLRLLGELAQYGSKDMPAFQEQIRTNLVCLLLHLSENDPSVVMACKYTLRSISTVLDTKLVGNMLKEHLIDEGNLQYQEFITDLSKLLVKEMPDNIHSMIITALPYSKSCWPEIRGNAALLIGLLYSNAPFEVRNLVSLETITGKLLQLVKDSEKEVKSKALLALSIIFIP